MADVVRWVESQIPFNRVLGLEVTHIAPAGVTVEFVSRPELVGNVALGILHGGVISAALDLVGCMTALAGLLDTEDDLDPQEIAARFSRFGTIDLRIDFLRPGAGERFRAQGTPLRLGRRVSVVRMELHNDAGTMIASGVGTYITG